MTHPKALIRLLLVLLVLAMPILAIPASAATGDTLVTVGSPPTPFPQNKQNEPGIAVNASNSMILAAGTNDELDLAPCSGSSCPFTTGVGVSGIYFSLDGGQTWTQPTYTGWSARTGTAVVGPIGTLPWYYENGLVSDGDPSLAFGPQLDGPGHFSWSNGARLYYANLTANFSAVRSETAFKGSEAIAVSRTDDPTGAAAGNQAAWLPPVIVSKQNAALFSDKEAIWADNAASSPNFGNVYLCNVAFRGEEKSAHAAPEPVMFTRSTDGGTTWSSQQQLSKAANNGAVGGRQGCTVRTDSHGVVYVIWEGALSKQSVQFLARSFDGGVSFEQPRAIASVVDVGQLDPVSGGATFDGVAGARTNSFPSVDIANGAPSGSAAPNTIVMSWADARNGLNNEQALVQYSTDGGTTWSTPVNGAPTSDRPDFPAVAISPDGQNIYLTYDAFLSPWQSTTASPRLMQGVVRHANGTASTWTTLHQGTVGDARGSSANSLAVEFLGDYNYVVATSGSGIAVWNDARNAADCPAIDSYRQNLATAVSPNPTPAPPTDCPATFGNTDVFGGAYTVATR
jgi:BNR/Asp-box repeat